MIEFRQKGFSDFSGLMDAPRIQTIKDFPQESVYKFFQFRGNKIYEDPIFSTIPQDQKLSKQKKGVWKPAEFKKIVRSAQINHPASHKDYKASEFIRLGKSGGIDPVFDLVFKVTKSGFIVSPFFDYYIFLAYTLGKYNSGNYDYQFVKLGSNSPSPIITVPGKASGLVELCMAFTEFAVSLKLFLGSFYRIVFIEEEVPVAKYFSVIDFIPTATSLIYKTILSPILKSRLIQRKDQSMKATYTPTLIPNLRKYAEKEWGKKLVIADSGTGSCFINVTENPDLIKMFSDKKSLEQNNIDPTRRRCELDWIAYAAQGIDNSGKSRDLILISDLDPVPAIFHELGHFMIKQDGTKGKIQRKSHTGIHSDGFASFVSFCLGMTGPIGEILGFLGTYLIKFPLLYSEFMASWYGLELMKKLGATEKDLENAKYTFRTAYSSYLVGVTGRATNSAWGRLAGEGWRQFIKRR